MCCIMGYAGHDLPKETFTEYLLRTASRGPDDQRVIETEFGLLGFGRLAIMGLTPEGMQPFTRGADCVACNGELYGFRPVKAELEAEGYTFTSDSDCEIILPLYYKYGLRHPLLPCGFSLQLSGVLSRPVPVPAYTKCRALCADIGRYFSLSSLLSAKA